MEDNREIHKKNKENPIKNFFRKHRVKVLIIISILLIIFVVFTVTFDAISRKIVLDVLNDTVNGKVSIKKMKTGLDKITIEEISFCCNESKPPISVKKIIITYDIFRLLEKPYGLKALKTVDIYEPAVILSYRKDGTCGLVDLFIQPEKPEVREKPVFHIDTHALVTIHDGRFEYKDVGFGGIEEAADSIKAQVRFRGMDNPAIESVTAKIDGGGKIHSDGHFYAGMTGMYANVKVAGIDLKDSGNYFARQDDFDIISGTADAVGYLRIEDFTDEKLDENIDYQARIDLNNVKVKYTLMPEVADGIEGEILLITDMLYLDNVTGFLRDMPFTLNGSIHGFNNPALGLYLRMPSLDLTKIKDMEQLKDLTLEIKGLFDVTGSLTGTARSPIIRGMVGFREIHVNGEKVENGKGDFEYFSDTVKVNLRKAFWQGGEFESSGFVDLSGSRIHFIFDFIGKDADVGRFARLIFPDYKIEAESNFEIKVMGSGEDPLMVGSAAISNAAYDHLTMDGGDGYFLYHGGTLLLQDLNMKAGGGRISSDGGFIDLENEYFDITLRAENFGHLPLLIPELNNISIETDFNIHAFGRLSSPMAYGSFSNASMSGGGSSITNGTGSFAYRNDILLMDNVNGEIDGANLFLSGWYHKKQNPSLEIVFNAEELRASTIANIIPGAPAISTDKSINLKGGMRGDGNHYQWSISGQGSLGEIVSFGDLQNPGDPQIQGAFIGWDMDFDDFVPDSSKTLINPGIGSLAVVSTGKLSSLNNQYHFRTDNGKVMGLPVSRGMGGVVYEGDTLKLTDTYWIGISPDKSRDSRIAPFTRLYNMSSYWGVDMNADKEPTLLARMYYQPFMLENVTYTLDGWQVNTLAPVPIRGKNPFNGQYTAVRGLPEVWGTTDYYQLKRSEDAGYPLSVSILEKEGQDTMAGRWRALEARIDGTVNLSKKTLDLEIRSDRMNLGMIESRLDLSKAGFSFENVKDLMKWDHIEGNATVSGNLSGNWASPVWNGRINIEDGIINNDFFAFDSDFSVNSKGIDIKDFNLTQSKSRFFGGGSIELDPGVNLDIRVNAVNGQLKRLLGFTPWKDIPASGIIDGDVHVRGNVEKLLIDGDLTVQDAMVFYQPISSLDIVIKSDREGMNLEKLQARIGDGILYGSGRTTNRDMDFNFTASDFSLKNIQILRESFPDISGTGDFRMNLGGTIKSPLLDLDMSARGFSIRGTAIDEFIARAKWNNYLLDIDKISMASAESYWNLKGRVEFPDSKIPLTWGQLVSSKNPPVFDIDTDFNKWQVQKILTMANHPMKDDITGILNGHLTMKGSMPEPDLEMEVTVEKGNIGEVPFDEISAFAKSNEDLLEISRLTFNSPTSKAYVSGAFNEKAKSLNFTFSSEKFPVEVIGAFSPKYKNLKGSLFTSGRIWGSPHTPNIEAFVNLSDSSYGNLSFDDAGGRINAKNGLVVFKDFALRKGKHKISLHGRVPLAIIDDRLVNTGEIIASANINENSLDIFKAFFPVVQETKGSFLGTLNVTGIYPDLKIDGQAHVRNGHIKTTLMENPVENLRADILFNGKQFVVKTLRGNLGQGLFNLNGFARLNNRNFEIDDMKFVLLGNNITVLIPNFIRGIIDTKVTVTGTPENMIIGDTLKEEGIDYLSLKHSTLSVPEKQLKKLSQIFPDMENDKEKSEREGREGERQVKEKHDEQDDEKALIEKINKDSNPTLNSLLSSDEEKENNTVKEDEGDSGFPLPLIKNFVLTMGDDVWFDYMGLYIRSMGNLKIVRQQEQSIRIFGELKFSRGYLKVPFLSSPFKVSEGTAYFGGGDPVPDKKTGLITDYKMNPYFDMSASSSISGYDVYMSYKGDMDSLMAFFTSSTAVAGADLQMYSVPALSRKQIMELLISSTFVGGLTADGKTGQSVNFEGTAVNLMTNYLQSVILGSLTRSFGRALSLAELNFNYNPSGYWTFQVSKAIDSNERFYITYSKEQGPQRVSIDVWGLEWVYKPGMRLRIQNSQDTFVYGVRGQVVFDSFAEFFTEMLNIANLRKAKKTPMEKSEERPEDK